MPKAMASLARPRGAPRKGARGGKYTTDRVIGRGSFGTAWLVRSNADSRMYVMKRLALDHMNEKEKETVEPSPREPELLELIIPGVSVCVFVFVVVG